MQTYFKSVRLARFPFVSIDAGRRGSFLQMSYHLLLAASTWAAITILPFTDAKADDTDTYYGVGTGGGGTDNSAFGFRALDGDSSYSVGIGSQDLTYGFLGTTDYRTGIGAYAAAMGDDNTSLGYQAGSGEYCSLGDPCYAPVETTGIGSLALWYNLGESNTGTGYSTIDDFSGSYDEGQMDTANGYMALHRVLVTPYNYVANNDTASGALALTSELNGGVDANDDTADGAGALQNCISRGNCAIGVGAIFSKAGANNTAEGWNALLSDLGNGSSNFAGGYLALSKNTSGSNNTGFGNNVLLANTTGGTNLALGDAAGSLLTTGSNNIEIANQGLAGESNTIRIGIRSQTVTNITGIRGTTVSGGIAVMIDANGRLGTTTSSAHFKEKIKPMAKNSEAIYSLQPVSFRYKRELDPAGMPQFGLVAEEVAKIDPDLVARDEQGKPYTVRYDAVNAMLLNEFLKERDKVEDQARINQKQLATNKDLQSTLAHQDAELEALAAQIAEGSDPNNL